MRMYSRKKDSKKGVESSIPNLFAFTFIRNFLNDGSYENIRKDYFINDLTPKQINQGMKDIKYLFKEYRGLDVITIEDENKNITKFIL